MKKITLALMVVLGFAISIGCAEPDGQGWDGSYSSGTKLVITNVDPASATFLFGDTPTFGGMDVTFESRVPEGADFDMASDILVTGYKIKYYSDDPAAVPLIPMPKRALNILLAPGESSTLNGAILVLPETVEEYWIKALAAGTFDQTVVYQAEATVYAENEYGYEIESFFYFTIWFVGTI